MPGLIYYTESLAQCSVYMVHFDEPIFILFLACIKIYQHNTCDSQVRPVKISMFQVSNGSLLDRKTKMKKKILKSKICERHAV